MTLSLTISIFYLLSNFITFESGKLNLTPIFPLSLSGSNNAWIFRSISLEASFHSSVMSHYYLFYDCQTLFNLLYITCCIPRAFIFTILMPQLAPFSH